MFENNLLLYVHQLNKMYSLFPFFDNRAIKYLFPFVRFCSDILLFQEVDFLLMIFDEYLKFKDSLFFKKINIFVNRCVCFINRSMLNFAFVFDLPHSFPLPNLILNDDDLRK